MTKKYELFSFSKQLLRSTRHLAQSSCQQEKYQHQQSMKGLTCAQNLLKPRKEENRKNWITLKRFRGCSSPSRWDAASMDEMG